MVKTWKAAACCAVATALAGCAVAPVGPDNRTTEQVVAETSGRPISVNNNVSAGLDAAIAPIINRCRRDTGNLVPLAYEAVSFAPYNGGTLPPMRVTLPSRLACRVAGQDVWGFDVLIGNPRFLNATYIGSGVNYYGTAITRFVSGQQMQADTANAAQLRAANQAAQAERSRECAALREAYVKRFRANPAPGMKVDRGMVIDVRGPIALVQYSTYWRQTRQKDQEWVQIQSLGPPEDCPQ